MRKRTIILLVLALSLPLFGAEPITFSGGATKLVMKEGRETVTLTGGAKIESGSMVLTADTITISGEEYRYVICSGSVHLTDTERGILLSTESLSYDRVDEHVLITGYVEIDDTANQVQASAFRLAYDVQPGLMELQVSVLLLRHTDSGAMVCSSDTITYDRTKETLRMFGNARVKWDGDTYEAQRVEVDLKSEEIVMKGAIKGVIGGS